MIIKIYIIFGEDDLMINNQQTKECSVCGKIKTLDQFYTQKRHNEIRGDWIYYNPECKECTKERSSKRQKENRQVITEKYREYYRVYFNIPENRNRHRETIKKRTKEGKQKEWYNENPDKFKIYAINHRHHKISNQEWLKCKEYFNNSCAYCGLHVNDHYTPFNGQLRKSDLHKEHVDHNGANDLSNCVPACRVCNSRKWTYALDEWYIEGNTNYTKERLNKIYEWLENDYKLHINKEITSKLK